MDTSAEGLAYGRIAPETPPACPRAGGERPVGEDGAPEAASLRGTEHLPLSHAQQRLWFLEQLDDVGSTYHLSRYIRLRGALDPAALARALERLAARHDALRATFHEVDGAPVQRIAPAADAACTLAVQELGGHADAEGE